MSTITSENQRRVTEATGDTEKYVDHQLRVFASRQAEHPGSFEDLGSLHAMYQSVAEKLGDPIVAACMILQAALNAKLQINELIDVLNGLKETKFTLGRVMSRPFRRDTVVNGHSYVYIKPLRDRAQIEAYQIADDLPDGANPDDPLATRESAPPEALSLGVIDCDNRLYLGSADVPAPPIAPTIHRISSVQVGGAQEPFDWLEIQGEEGEIRSSEPLIPCVKELASDVQQKIDDGEQVSVRVVAGVAQAIHTVDDQKTERWLEFLPFDAPGLETLVFKRKMAAEWDRIAKRIAKGRGTRNLLIGPTGNGKTAGVKRVGVTAARLAVKAGKEVKGIALITISSATTGSIYVHGANLQMKAALVRAEGLARKGYIAIVLIDEGDALLGEMIGYESDHSRSERLTGQSLFSEDIPGVGVFLTMNNARPNSHLPAAVSGRFISVVYRRAGLGQMRAVARMYCEKYPEAMRVLDVSSDEVASAFVDSLFSERRVLATVHMDSGRKRNVLARDMPDYCCPRKVESLIGTFLQDIQDGLVETPTLADLIARMDAEITTPNLSRSNIWTVTFLTKPPDDDVNTIEWIS